MATSGEGHAMLIYNHGYRGEPRAFRTFAAFHTFKASYGSSHGLLTDVDPTPMHAYSYPLVVMRA